MTFLSEQESGQISLTVYVQPRSSRTRLAGLHGEAIKICITAPPVDDKANSAVIVFLAKLFNIPKSAVAIQSGKQSRTKQLTLNGLSLAAARQILTAALRS